MTISGLCNRFLASRPAMLMMLAISVLFANGLAHAQSTWPSKPVRIVVAFAPGSGSDSFARFVANPLSKALGQPVVVENRPGGDGVIGIQEVMRSEADGHTLLLGSNSLMVLNPLVRADLPYKPQNFRPLGGLVRAPVLFVTAAESPLRDARDLVAEARSKPGQLSVASYAPALRMVVAWLESVANIQMVQVNYKGASQLMTDLGGGQIPAAMVDATAAMTLMSAGKIRGLGLAAADRHPGMAAVPTMAELGYPGFEHYSWLGLYAMASMPDEVAARLEATLAAITQGEEFRGFVEKTGGFPMNYGAPQMNDWLKAETERYRQLARAAGIL